MKNLIKDERGSLAFIVIILFLFIFFSGIILAFTSDFVDMLNLSHLYDNTPLVNNLSSESTDFGNAFILLIKFVGILILGRIVLWVIIKQQEIENRGE